MSRVKYKRFDVINGETVLIQEGEVTSIGMLNELRELNSSIHISSWVELFIEVIKEEKTNFGEAIEILDHRTSQRPDYSSFKYKIKEFKCE